METFTSTNFTQLPEPIQGIQVIQDPQEDQGHLDNQAFKGDKGDVDNQVILSNSWIDEAMFCSRNETKFF